MTAVLCRHFGLKHMEIAEDIASDTFLKASENWAIHGIPENPTAWLYTVARNKARDYFKHLAVFDTQVKEAIRPQKFYREPEFEYSPQSIADSQLAMIFAVCNPINSPESQICLALQILCGFSVEEIAHAFITKTETIKKRLQRARANLRQDNFQIRTLHATEIQSRLDTVLKTLYLLFNEGYFSHTHSLQIRKDLCAEAVRLALVLTENPWTNTPQTNALLALMCFQSSRLESRINDAGEAVLFDQQDRSRWDTTLIDRGNYFLVKACDHQEISKYHLEAAVAYWHTTPTGQNKWAHILALYDQLILIEDSPVTLLNRIFAYSQVHGREKALAEAGQFKLAKSHYYHQLMGYLYAEADIAQAISHYQQAIQGTKSATEKQTLTREIARLKKTIPQKSGRPQSPSPAGGKGANS